MSKIKKSKLKLFGITTCSILLCLSYVGISFYSVPGKANAITWLPKNLTQISTLQEMNKSVCDNSKIGDTNNNIKDIRDDNVYSIAKLSDGKCWMTQNLRLAGGTTLTSADSNVPSNYTLPSATSGAFSSTDPTLGQMRNSTDNDYGAYYSFNAATAGTAAAQTSGSVGQDICPKGWRLPTGGSDGEFQILYNHGSILGGEYIEGNLTPGYWFGGSANVAGGAFFPAAGYVMANDDNIVGVGSTSVYWSSIIKSSTDIYVMGFHVDKIYLNNSSNRYYGYSVRCIANEKVLESSSPTTSVSGSISVKVANTLSIDAVSGMEEEVDSTSIANGTITATIAANTNYKVLLSAGKTSLTSTNTANDAEIPALPTVQAGTNAWGILNSDNTTYSAITTKEAEYYHTTAPSTNPDILGTVHTFTVGISVSPSLPSDTYSTDVTITAAAA